MTAASPSYDPNLTQQNNSNNPALNQQAFQRTIARTGAKETTGMTARGTYLKMGLLLLMLIAAGAPKFMEWYGAYGLMLSIVWMYVSILRLLALLRSRR